MSVAIKKAEKELQKLKDELKEFDENYKCPEVPEYPSVLKYKCPCCGAKPDNKCITRNGHTTKAHYDRVRLIDEDSANITRTYNEICEKRCKITYTIRDKEQDISKLKAAEKKSEEERKFLESLGDVGNKSELSLKWNGYELKVTRVRNLKGLMPDDVVPSKSLVDILIDRGIDVIVEKEDSRKPVEWCSPWGMSVGRF